MCASLVRCNDVEKKGKEFFFPLILAAVLRVVLCVLCDREQQDHQVLRRRLALGR